MKNRRAAMAGIAVILAVLFAAAGAVAQRPFTIEQVLSYACGPSMRPTTFLRGFSGNSRRDAVRKRKRAGKRGPVQCMPVFFRVPGRPAGFFS